MKRPMIVSRDAFIAKTSGIRSEICGYQKSAAVEELASGEIGLM